MKTENRDILLKRESDYFFMNEDELVQRYYNSFLVIVDEEVVGAYPTELEAYEMAKKRFHPGTFLIQHCLPKGELAVLTFSTPIIYARS